jgi:hypothetical protein
MAAALWWVIGTAGFIRTTREVAVPILTLAEYIDYRLAAQHLSEADWLRLHDDPANFDLPAEDYRPFGPGLRVTDEEDMAEARARKPGDISKYEKAGAAVVNQKREKYVEKGKAFAKKMGGAIRGNMVFFRLNKEFGIKDDVVKSIGSAIAKTHKELKKIAAADLPLVDQQLLLLGEYLVQAAKGLAIDLEWVQGPIKTTGSAMEKIIKRVNNPSTHEKPGKLDVMFNVYAMKDLVRGTLVAKEKHDLDVAVQLVFATCNPALAMTLPKQEETVPGGKDNECGYSGWNFNVNFRHYGFPAEIQVNTVAMIYAKETKKVFMELTHWDEAKYDQLARDMGILGGLGHVCYEIYRTHPQYPLPKTAAAFSREYYDVFRSGNPAAGRSKIRDLLMKLANEIAEGTTQDHPNIAKIRDKKEGVWGHAGVEEWLDGRVAPGQGLEDRQEPPARPLRH